MRRGTTPTILLEMPYSNEGIENLWCTISSEDGRELFTKEKGDEGIDIRDQEIELNLSQDETLILGKLFDRHNSARSRSVTASWTVLLQVRIIFEDGTAVASNIVNVPVRPILKDGVIK